MDFRKRIFLITIILVMVCGGSVRADMVQIVVQQAEQQAEYSCAKQIETEWKNLAGSYDNPVTHLIDFGLKTVQVASQTSTSTEQTHQVSPSLELKSEQGSLSLCLYALMSFGLCSAPHWLKRFSFGPVPDWYHTGGPYQIGHSFAAPPDFHRTVKLILHFIQPNIIILDSIPRYQTRIVISLWRESQFILEKTASRAPPFIA